MLANCVVGANQLNPPLSHSIAFAFTFTFIFTLSIHTQNHGIHPHVHMRLACVRVFSCIQLQNIIWPCHDAIGPLHTKTLSIHLYALTHTHPMFTCEFTHIEHSLACSTCHAHGLAHSTHHSHACLKPFSQPFTSLNHHFNASLISK